MSNIINIVLVSALRMAMPLALTATGAAFSIRAGVSDLGCEGMMIMGSFFSVYGSYVTGNPWIGVVFGMIFGMLISLVHVILHVNFKVNATISGMSVNMLGAALAPLLLNSIWGTQGNSPQVNAFKSVDNTFIKNIPIIGTILSQQNPLFFVTIILVVLGWIFMFKTTKGLRMRMVGENPQAASTVGINVVAYKYFGVLICGLMCGLGGAYLSLGQLNLFVDGMTSGRGYIAVVINAFGKFNPFGTLGGSIFFGFFDSLQTVLQSEKIPSHLIMILPYLLTLIVLSLGVKKSRSPAGVGKHHDE